MPSHTHSDLEELKRKAKEAKIRKQREKSASDPSTLQPTDVLFVLHSEEVETLEDLLLDVLVHWDDTLSSKQKRHVLGILKYIQED